MNLNRSQLPQELLSALEGESINFIVRPRKSYPKEADKGTLYTWGFILIILFYFSYYILKTLIVEDLFLSAELIPILGILTLLVLAIISLAQKTFKQLFQKGGCFVGTDTRLIRYIKGKLVIREWQDFSGHIIVDYKNNEIVLRTIVKPEYPKGKVTRERLTRSGTGLYGIDDLEEILQICRNCIEKYK